MHNRFTNIDIDAIQVSAVDVPLEDAVRDAVRLAFDECKRVSLRHDREVYDIDPDDIMAFLMNSRIDSDN